MLCRRLVAVCGNDLLGMRGMFSFVRFLTKIVSMRKIAALLLRRGQPQRFAVQHNARNRAYVAAVFVEYGADVVAL